MITVYPFAREISIEPMSPLGHNDFLPTLQQHPLTMQPLHSGGHLQFPWPFVPVQLHLTAFHITVYSPPQTELCFLQLLKYPWPSLLETSHMLPHLGFLPLDLCPSPLFQWINTHQKYLFQIVSSSKTSLTPLSRWCVSTIWYPCQVRRVFVIEKNSTPSHNWLLSYLLCPDVGFQYVQHFHFYFLKPWSSATLYFFLNKQKCMNEEEIKKDLSWNYIFLLYHIYKYVFYDQIEYNSFKTCVKTHTYKMSFIFY